jgi:hypothetical protein
MHREKDACMTGDLKATGKAAGGKARAESLTAESRTEIAKKAAEVRWSQPQMPAPPTLKSIAYKRDEQSDVALQFDPAENEIWASQAQIAAVFGVIVPTINDHLKSLFRSQELEENVVLRKFRITAADGKAYLTSLYNLDAIIAVGYSVNSKEATRFRSWSSSIVKAYLEQGYVINDKALRESPEKLNKLAAEIRALRSSEKQVYAKVRECFKVSSSDYDPSARQVRTFYALLQDKFHHAVTGMTGSKLVLDRADHREPKMGLRSLGNESPTVADATTSKNYLREDELYRLHLLSEQFLLYAESTALSGRKMTMKSLHEQLDRLLTLNDYPVFDGYKDYIKEEAVRHAKAELGLYKKRMKIESLGITYDEEALAYGEYDEFLMGA